MRKLIIFVLILGVLGIGAYGGRRGYRIWKQHHAVQKARESIAKSDYNKALLWLRKALQANGNNLDAVRMMGDFAEVTRSPNAVHWRSRLAQIEPNSFTNQLMLARAAVIHREFAIAKKALDSVNDDGKKTADYHKIKGTLALATRQFLDAEQHFEEAGKIEPQNPIPHLNLAILRVQRIDTNLAAQARHTLETLRTNATVRTDALRNLALDAFRRTNYARALALTGELLLETNSIFSDRLLQLDVLKAAQSPQFKPTIAGLQQQVATNPLRVYGLSNWMLMANGPADTLAWLQTLEPQIRTNLPVTMVVADSYLISSNWTGLQAYVSKQNWGELEHLRLLFSARSFREQNLATTSKSEWSKALKAAGDRFDRLSDLDRLASAWNWPAENEEVLWATLSKFPAEKRAVQALSNLLYVGGKTRDLLTLYAQEAKSDPKNLAVKNNLASVALLLDAQVYKPHELAREVHEKQLDNPIYASTYAFSLHKEKKTSEALKVMGQLKPEQLEQPQIACYYGLMLSASGDKAEAGKYFKLSSKGLLLPEERELVERAKL